MLPARMLPHRITILTRGTATDAYGNTVPDWVTATSRTAAAYVRPASSSTGGPTSGDEYVDVGRDVIDRSFQVHTNDAAINALDRVVHDGVTYEVDGQPAIWTSAPGGRLGHTKFRMRRVDG